jgi:hypothetical protein
LRFVVTARLTIRYRKPVPVETPLKLTGRIVEDKGKVITVAGEILGPDGTLLAEAEAVIVEVDPSFFGDAVLSSQDWQVLPDQDPADPDYADLSAKHEEDPGGIKADEVREVEDDC